MERVFRVAGKEFRSFFSSPVGFIFLGAFLAVNLFLFFWVEAFFATNIAEVRALFSWMPILLIFLTAAITMRLWAEERRAGTLEFLLTAPVGPQVLVLGKFLGCLGLVVLALALTLPLPLSVSFIGPLDWGPVWGGYVAAVFLASAYIAIGLYVSVKSENQIVSLIVAVLVCSVFYLLGSDLLTSLMGTETAELFRAFGSGSRFASITRGVIDFRDLYYYLAIVGVFVTLNVFGLEKLRWAGNPGNSAHRRWRLLSGLFIANFIAANFWLAPIGSLRADLTEDHIYSISEATRSYLHQLEEPLLLRGYFSAQTHPLLAPLVPRLKDLLREYAVVGGDRVRVEFVDPLEHPELEEEAGRKFGIRPVPFQTTSKYQASVTNSYFDIVVQYGDQYETLGFRDLIEVKVKGEGDVEVELRNPEYDITRAIRKTLYSYRSDGDIFADIGKPVTFTAYVSEAEKLPASLAALKEQLAAVLAELEQQGGERFSAALVDPEAGSGEVARQLEQEYGFQPMAASLFAQQTFWFYMVLESGGRRVEVPLPEEFDRESLERAIASGLKRFASGFTKTIAVHSQPATPPMPQYGMPPRGKQFNIVKGMLEEEHTVVDADLKNGTVPADADLLLLLSPEELGDRQLFAVDQFLMRGGTVIVATSPYDIEMNEQLALVELDSGLADWLSFNGIDIAKKLVLDARNSAFPIPTQRDIGGFTVQQTRMIDYPYFIDIRPDGMNGESGFLQGIDQLTMNWASPIQVREEDLDGRSATWLLRSSPESWLTGKAEVQPDFASYPQHGFPRPEDAGAQLLGVSVGGRFTSYFKGKPSPLLAGPGDDTATGKAGGEDGEKNELAVSRMIDHSADSARIICFSSNTFLADSILSLGAGVRRTGYLEPVQMIANAIDWSLEDSGLLAIRGRSHFSRPLEPLGRESQLFFEYLNYGLALAGLLLVWLFRLAAGKRALRREYALLEQTTGRNQ